MRVPLALAAEASSVSVRTLRRWSAEGRLTVVTNKRGWYLVDLDEVAELEELRLSHGGRLT
jgi:predicted site-specific integrase-resolvase